MFDNTDKSITNNDIVIKLEVQVNLSIENMIQKFQHGTTIRFEIMAITFFLRFLQIFKLIQSNARMYVRSLRQ